MNEQELCKKRLIDLSRQADQKGIVLFSDFLNLNEQELQALEAFLGSISSTVFREPEPEVLPK